MNLNQKKVIKELVRTYFKDRYGKPFELTNGECEILKAVLQKSLKYVWVSAPTRYGKTNTIALGLIILAVFYKLKIPVIAGSEEKARKIMDYILDHIANHPELYRGLINLKGIRDIEKLKISVSKDTLRWASGGWIYITSVDSRSVSKEGERAVGEGGDVVVLEEAGLIKRKEQFSKIVRMTEGEWGKLIMAGNCMERSVFETAYKDDLYYKVRITLDQAIKEGRITQRELEAKKTQVTTKDWKRFYLVEFPKANEFAYFKPRKYEYLPNELEYYGSLDPALGEAKKGSLVGIVILGRTKDGKVYEVESIGKQIKPEEAIREVFNFPYEFQRFGIEEIQFQKYFLQEMDRKSIEQKKYIPFIGIKQSRKKEERIESLEPVINTEQILFKGENELWDEMQNYPDIENLDCLDALEMAWRLVSGRVSPFPDQDLLPGEKGKPFSAGFLGKDF